MIATDTATKFVAPEGMGVWDSEAEFVASFNAEMRDCGLSKRITSVADLDLTKRTITTTQDMPSRIDRDSLPQRQGNGNTNGSGKARGKGATDKQLEWLVKMHNVKAENAQVDAITAKAVAKEFVSFDEAKLALDYVFNKSVAYRARKVTVTAKSGKVTEDGYYRKDGTYYKVQIAKNGSGNLYAKVWDAECGSWEYTPGAINKISADDKLSVEEAGEFGKLYGVCIRCTRPLTDEESIAAGIGPICAGKW